MTISRRTAAPLICATGIALFIVACGGTQRRPSDELLSAPLEPVVHPQAISAYLQGETLLRRGHLTGAVAALQEAAELDDSPWIAQRLSEALRQSEDFEGAIAACELAAARGAAEWEAGWCTARAHAAAENTESALRVMQTTDTSGASREFFTWWYETATRTDDPGAPITAAQAAVDAYPESPVAWRRLALSNSAAGNFDQALLAYEQAYTLPDGDASSAEEAVMLQQTLSRHAAALATADECIARYPERIGCYLRRVTIFDRNAERDDPVSEDTDRALRDLARMTTAHPAHLRNAAQALQQVGRSALVSRYAVNAAALRPFDASLIEAAAWVCSRIGDEDRAIELMLRLIELDTTHATAMNFVGYAWAERGENLREAQALIERALAEEPGSAGIMDSLAWVLHRRGRHRQALELQEQAIAIAGEDAVLLDHLGDILSALGRRAQAVDAWRRALAVADARDEDVLQTVPAKIEAAGGILSN